MPSYIAGLGPRSNLTSFSFACINSKDIRIQLMMLQSKFRKLVTLEKSASAFAMKLERTSANIYRKNYE